MKINPDFSPVKLLIIKLPNEFSHTSYSKVFSLLNWKKINSYLQKKDQLRAFASELLQKYWLPSILGVHPQQLELNLTKDMKPYITKPKNISKAISFNVSHSGEYVAIAVSFDSKISIGIDIELIQDDFPILEAKSLVFSKSEQAQIGTSVSEFFKLWTKKEALIKAIGYGFNHEYFKTTNLNLDYIEVKENYSVVTHKFGNYFLSIGTIFIKF